MTWRVLPVLALLAAVSCRGDRPQGPVEHAAFGVLFGGQVQQLDEIPFELDREADAGFSSGLSRRTPSRHRCVVAARHSPAPTGATDQAGITTYVIDNLGSWTNRRYRGTYTHGNEKGTFDLVLN